MEKMPENPVVSPERDTRMEKRREAAEAVRSLLHEKLADTERSLKKGGREYPLTSSVDALVAEEQRKVAAAEEVLAEARERDDYFVEEAALLLLELFSTEEKFSSAYAGFAEKYPEAVAELQKAHPELHTLKEEGDKAWSETANKAA